jgi:hypothetical protein
MQGTLQQVLHSADLDHVEIGAIKRAIAREAELVTQLGKLSEAQTTHKFECELRAENERLRGIKPELGSSYFGGPLPRFGIRWNGAEHPLSVPMDDGYWTPWHFAEQRIAELEAKSGWMLVNTSPERGGEKS